MSVTDIDIEARLLFKQAKQLQRQSKYKEAADLYGKCLEIDSRFYSAAYAQASCYGSLGIDDVKVVQAYQRALQIDRHTNSGAFSIVSNNVLIMDGYEDL